MFPRLTACHEVTGADDSRLDAVRKLYKSTEARKEQILWEWLEKSIRRRADWEPGQARPHLVLAEDPDSGEPHGFTYGFHLPDFGGYICYLGVDPSARKRGVGTALFDAAFRLFAEDAALEGAGLPLVLWESHPPEPGDPPAAKENWKGRMKLFGKVGGLVVDDLTFYSPDYGGDSDRAVPLKLFVKPFERPAESFGPEELKGLALSLHRRVYRHDADDPLVRRTLPPGCKPRLRKIDWTRPDGTKAGALGR